MSKVIKNILLFSISIMTFFTLTSCTNEEYPPKGDSEYPLENHVVFMHNGQIHGQEPIINNRVSLPNDPIHTDGYVFIGWYIDDVTFSNAFINTYVNSDIVFARFVDGATDHRLNIESQFGNVVDYIYVVSGRNIRQALAAKNILDLNKYGHTFHGWYFNANNLDYQTIMSNAPASLFGHWTINTHNIIVYLGLGEEFTWFRFDDDRDCLRNIYFNTPLTNLLLEIIDFYTGPDNWWLVGSDPNYENIHWLLTIDGVSYEIFDNSDLDNIVMPNYDVVLELVWERVYFYVYLIDDVSFLWMPSIAVRIGHSISMELQNQFLSVNQRQLPGHEFLGWYLYGTNELIDESLLMGMDSITLVARWERSQHNINVIFNAGGLEKTFYGLHYGDCLNKIISDLYLYIPISQGRRFSHWILIKGSQMIELIDRNMINNLTMPDEDIQLSGYWLFENQFIVTLDLGYGGVFHVNQQQQVNFVLEYGENVFEEVQRRINMYSPRRHGFEPIFYWYFQGEELDSEKEMPFENIMLFARWIQTSYFTITIMDRNNQVQSEVQIRYKELIEIEDPIVSHMDFLGWSMHPISWIPLFEYMPAANISVWPELRPHVFRVNIENDQSIKEISDIAFIRYENSILTFLNVHPDIGDLSISGLVPGYIFNGWYIIEKNEYGMEIRTRITSEKRMPSREINVATSWSTINFNVNIDTDGGAIDYEFEFVVYYGDFLLNRLQEIQPYISKIGHTFANWLLIGYGIVTENTRITQTSGNIMILVLWNINDYQISFDTGYVNWSLESVYLQYNSIIATAIEGIIIPLRDGYEFSSWQIYKSYIYIDEYGNEEERSGWFDLDSEYRLQGNTTLRAVWNVI